jgi:hypothetical protein
VGVFQYQYKISELCRSRCEWLAEIDAVGGELDILRLAKANSGCRLRGKGILQKITFDASGSNYAYQKAAESINMKAIAKSLVLIRWRKSQNPSTALAALPFAAAWWLWDEKGE